MEKRSGSSVEGAPVIARQNGHRTKAHGELEREGQKEPLTVPNVSQIEMRRKN